MQTYKNKMKLPIVGVCCGYLESQHRCLPADAVADIDLEVGVRHRERLAQPRPCQADSFGEREVELEASESVCLVVPPDHHLCGSPLGHRHVLEPHLHAVACKAAK